MSNPLRTTPRFRADHVGSLLRRQALLTARAGFKGGKLAASSWGHP
jgi:hypothetical protein